jgi:hypothetical protein
MSSTLSVRSVVASAFCVLDRYTSEHFGRLRSTRGEGACGVSAWSAVGCPALIQAVSGIYTRDHNRCYLLIVTLLA